MTTGILSYFQPFQLTIEEWTKGHRAAMAAGDIEFACAMKFFYCTSLFAFGTTLSILKEEYARADRVSPSIFVYVFTCRLQHHSHFPPLQFLEGYNNKNVLFFVRIYRQTVSRLTGDAQDVFSGDEITNALTQNKNPLHLVIL